MKQVVLQIVLIVIFSKIKVDSYTSSPIEDDIDFHTVIILIKSVIIEEKLNCYNIILEKGSYKGKSNT